jgi:hypothetical protein
MYVRATHVHLQEVTQRAARRAPGAHTVSTIPLRAVRKEARANTLHVHEEWKLVPGHMGNGRNVLPRHDKPVLKSARVLGRERHHLPHGAHVLAGVPPARGAARHARHWPDTNRGVLVHQPAPALAPRILAEGAL